MWSFLTLPTSAALAALAYVAVTALRVCCSDCDLATSAALRGFPRRGAYAGQVVLITGASSGIGLALALEFARGGAILILSARRAPELEAVARECRAIGATSADTAVFDALDTASHESFVARLLAKYGRIDVLVNNAGRSQRGLVERTAHSVDVDLMALNFLAVVSLTKAVLRPTLEANRKLRILNTSSVAGLVGSPISAACALVAHHLKGWMDTCRMELSTRNVQITNACPGPTQSEITLHAFAEDGRELGTADEAGAAARMPAERCALLMASALYAGIEEAWISPQPILLFVYIAQYMRSAYFSLGRNLGAKRVAAFKEGRSGYGAYTLSAAVAGAKEKAP